MLRQYKAAMPSNLPLKLHTTCAGWEAVKNWRNLPTKKSRLRSFYSWAHRRGYIAKPIEFDGVKTPPSAPKAGFAVAAMPTFCFNPPMKLTSPHF